jgi:tricarballylate dehydrogenase
VTLRRIVVIGHGAAGLSAALAAVEAAREGGVPTRVTLVERGSPQDCGGNSRWSPANIRMRSPHAMEDGFVDAVATKPADRPYYERLAQDAPATAAWLQRLGVAFHSPPYYLAKGPARIQPVGGGAALFDALWRAARAAGVDFLYQRHLKRLLLRGNAIVGIDAGEEIPADSVVLACGGFEGSDELLDRHFGAGARLMRRISPGTSFNDGAGIAAALAIGARPAGDWGGMHAEPVDARSKASAPIVLVYPYGIVVDDTGRRFFDEGRGLVHETWEQFARELHFSLPGRRAWAILDASLYDIPDYGRAIRSEVPPVSADSVAGLAAQIGIPPKNLQKTVAAYNTAVPADASGFDATRADGLASAPGLQPPKSNWARRLERAPFLAWPLEGAIVYTFGGLDTDAQARVRGAGGPIPGLYAAGEITGHFHGTAPNSVAMLRALVFGRIAGTQAALSKEKTATP